MHSYKTTTTAATATSNNVWRGAIGGARERFFSKSVSIVMVGAKRATNRSELCLPVHYSASRSSTKHDSGRAERLPGLGGRREAHCQTPLARIKGCWTPVCNRGKIEITPLPVWHSSRWALALAKSKSFFTATRPWSPPCLRGAQADLLPSLTFCAAWPTRTA